MEYTEDADRRELLLHSAYDSDTVRAMERPLLDKGVPLMRMAAQAAAHMAAGMLDDEDLALEASPPHSPPPLVSTARLPMSPPCQTVSRQAIFRWYLPWIRHPASV